MDYLFVQGKGLFASRAAESLTRRVPATTLVPQTLERLTVAEFLTSLEAGTIPKPIGDLLIAAHASRSGYLKIFLDAEQLDSGSGIEMEFETLDDANRSGSVRLPASLVTNVANGTMVPITLHIHGCEIGLVTKWVTKLRDALTPIGGSMSVVAPRHLDTFKPVEHYGY